MLQLALYDDLGDAVAPVTIPATATTADAQAIVDTLQAQNDRVFKVTVISALVVGIAAVLNTVRLASQLKRDHQVIEALARK